VVFDKVPGHMVRATLKLPPPVYWTAKQDRV